MYLACRSQFELLQHDNTHPTHLCLVYSLPLINSTREQGRAPVEEVIMQCSIAGLEFLISQKQRVILQCERVEDVEIVSLGEDESVVNELLQTGLQKSGLLGGFQGWDMEGGSGGVIKKVGCADCLIGFDDGGLGFGMMLVAAQGVMTA